MAGYLTEERMQRLHGDRTGEAYASYRKAVAMERIGSTLDDRSKGLAARWAYAWGRASRIRALREQGEATARSSCLKGYT